jgi:hypothetical protein
MTGQGMTIINGRTENLHDKPFVSGKATSIAKPARFPRTRSPASVSLGTNVS